VRTTITIDPDVAALLDAVMRERGTSFKEAVNTALRAGLTAARREAHRFEQETYAMGEEPTFRWAKALATAEAMEDEELSRKLAMRK
jgi:Arc/MetJ family transcription regulator